MSDADVALKRAVPPKFAAGRHARALTLAGAGLFFLAGCRQKEKRVLRTEPWQAPVAISASGQAPSPAPGKPVRYAVENARVSLELPAGKKKLSGTLARVDGTIDLDVQRPENTRATLRADLTSLALGMNGREDSPELLARAFHWLELSSGRPAQERDKDRYAELEIRSFDPLAVSDDARRNRPVAVVARGDLTLHHFRVPVTLELEVVLRSATQEEPSSLSIRTRRPLVVSLVAHDILPRDSQGALRANAVRSQGAEIGREARVSATLTAKALPQNP